MDATNGCNNGPTISGVVASVCTYGPKSWADPGIFYWGVEDQSLIQKGLLNFFCGKLPLTETTTCFFERRSPLAREVLLCEQRRTDHRRVHCKLKRSVSAPKFQFSPAGQSLVQPFLEPFEPNLGQKSSIKRLFQPTVGPISALEPNQP